MTFFDGWRALNTRLDAGDLTAPTQLVAYKLFAIFNERRFPESLPVSDRELLSRTNLKSTKTIFEARRQLKNAGIFDFTAESGKTTRYKFGKQLINSSETVGKQLINSSETVGKQLVNSSETPAPNPNIHARDKTEDVKTKDFQSFNPPRACAPVNWDCENELATLWLDNGGARVTAELLSYFQALSGKHGVEWTASAIREAASAFSGNFAMSLNYLRGCVKRKLEGGEKHAKARANRSNVIKFAANSSGKGRFDDDEPDCSWLHESNGSA